MNKLTKLERRIESIEKKTAELELQLQERPDITKVVAEFNQKLSETSLKFPSGI